LDGATVSNLTTNSGTADPTGNLAGELFFRTDLGMLRVYNGSTWQTVGGEPGSDNFGYLNMPQNLQNATYTFVLTDQGKHIFHTETTARTYTIPPNSSVAFPVGTAITIINGLDAGVISITQGAGVTLRQAGNTNTGTRTLAANGIATLIKVDSNIWYVSGVGVT
jgi:hypothetical protein